MELELVETQANPAADFNKSDAYTKLQPLGKIPAFEGANGFTLSEVIAIAVYGTYTIVHIISDFQGSSLLYMMSNFIISYPCQNNTVDNVQTLNFLVTPPLDEIFRHGNIAFVTRNLFNYLFCFDI